MTAEVNYADLVAQAEKAVQSVKDPELKRIAFQKVLEELLDGGAPKERRASVLPKPARAKAAGAKKPAAGGPMAYIREMISEQFFKKPKAIADVKAELENRGHHIPITSLSGPLQSLCKAKELRRNRNDAGVFVYSNW